MYCICIHRESRVQRKMQARFRGGSFSSIAIKENDLLHPISSGFESRATHAENKKRKTSFFIFTHFNLSVFGTFRFSQIDIYRLRLVDIGI